MGGVRMQAEPGMLSRIRRTRGAPGVRPPKPRTVPLYAFLYYLPLLASPPGSRSPSGCSGARSDERALGEPDLVPVAAHRDKKPQDVSRLPLTST